MSTPARNSSRPTKRFCPATSPASPQTSGLDAAIRELIESTTVPDCVKNAFSRIVEEFSPVLDETMEKTHLRVIMLHEFKLRRSVSEATQNIKMAWGEDSANERTVRRWYQKFRVGDVDLEDKDRSGRPAKCDDGRLKE
ncbi:unnamed protein product [Heligmosomoides polygyrus]|uniref:HTH_48 domain-containing protein n=1 Tax=Heligmosomoides polygyrus TaxID=6339 RepID=A0A3P7ZY42_HELPZ|nr:unnamed protein product [Heligmosomoides polygyrus]